MRRPRVGCRWLNYYSLAAAAYGAGAPIYLGEFGCATSLRQIKETLENMHSLLSKLLRRHHELPSVSGLDMFFLAVLLMTKRLLFSLLNAALMARFPVAAISSCSQRIDGRKRFRVISTRFCCDILFGRRGTW
jgi:hypothetical protein